MTAISILGGDWEILLDDEKNQNGGTTAVAGMRSIQKAVATPTIVTTRTLYSAVAEAMDDFIAMGFRNSMLPTTPNAYTMENKYFIPRSSVEFLQEGAITANWGLTASPDSNGNGVIKKYYLVDSNDTDFVAADIGRRITDGTDHGTLLDFDQDPDGQKVAWIRPEDSTPTTGDIFDSATGQLEVTTDGGTGTVSIYAAGTEGTQLWSAIQAIGAVPAATEVYIYQDRAKLPNSAGDFQWWVTDDTVSLGIISVLVPVQLAGDLIADGDVEVFARRYTALYDNFRLNVSGGGFSALPLASGPDINNTTGYRTTNLSTSSGTWTVGNGIYQGASWATATARGVITGGDNLGTADPDVEYYLVGDLTELSTGATAVTEYDFDTQANGDASATTVDSVGVNLGGPTDTTSGEGGNVTIELGGFLVDHDGNGTAEPYSIRVNAQNNIAVAKVYERIKYVTRRGADELDLFGAGQYGPAFDGATAVDDTAGNESITLTSHEYSNGDKVVYSAGGGTAIGGLTEDTVIYYIGVIDANTVALYTTFADGVAGPKADDNRINLTDGVGAAHTLTKVVNIPGESYRGLDGVFEYDANNGTMNEGENVDTVTGGSTWTGRLLHQNTTWGDGTYITVTDQQTSIDALANNDVVSDESGAGTRDVTLDSAGTVGFTTFTSPKSSPFGTFTGTQIFGARGVVYINPNTGDEQAYILTDDVGNLNNPPNTVTFTVTNTAAFDRILVARDTGVDGIIDKDQHGGLVTPATTYNGQGDIEIRTVNILDDEVPQSGYVRIVETTLRQEHKYVYDSITRDISGDGLFTLRDITGGTADAGTSDTVLEDAAHPGFVTEGVEVGMLIRITAGGGSGNIYEVTAVTDEDTLAVVQIFGTGGGLTTGSTYVINELIQNYATSDDVYDLILDLEASGTSVSNTFTKTLAANFDVVVNVRQGKVILPFTLNQEQGDGSTTVTVVRQPDTIAV